MGNLCGSNQSIPEVKKSVEKPKDIVHEKSIKTLNATVLTQHDVESIMECAKELEEITNPLIIIISHKLQNSEVITYEQPEHILIFTGQTHKKIKDKIGKSLGQRSRNKTLFKYDGVIVVLLAIGKIHKYEYEDKETEIMKYYYDSKNDSRHVDKTTKDILFRIDNLKLYMHYGEVVVNRIETGKGRPADHNYSYGSVKQLKQKKMNKKIAKAKAIIRGYCITENQTDILLDESILETLFKYYFGEIRK
eukprot:402268_1